MDPPFGKFKVNRLSKAWAEATIIWPGELKVEGEDEAMIINLLIIWRHMPLLGKDRCPLIWSHVSKNLDDVIKKWLLITNNAFALPNIQFFTTVMVMNVLDRIWKSNFNVTILRKYRPVLQKAAADIENHSRGGIRSDFKSRDSRINNSLVFDIQGQSRLIKSLKKESWHQFVRSIKQPLFGMRMC